VQGLLNSFDLHASVMDLYYDAGDSKPTTQTTLGEFMEVNAEGFPASYVLGIIADLLNNGECIRDEGSGGTWKLRVIEWKARPARPPG